MKVANLKDAAASELGRTIKSMPAGPVREQCAELLHAVERFDPASSTQKDTLRQWRGVDLGSLLLDSDGVQQSNWSKSLKHIVYVLGFLPVVLTWHAINQASLAYGRLIDAPGPAPRKSFIELWQTGFGGELSGAWRFSNVAGVVVLTVIAIMAVTVGWNVREGTRQRRVLDQRVTAKARVERLMAATQVHNPLAEGAQEVENASRLLALASEDLRQLIAANQQLSRSMEAAAADARKSIEQEVRALNSVAQDLVPTLQTAIQQLGSDVKAASAHSAQAMDRLQSQLNAFDANYAQFATTIRAVLEQIESALAQWTVLISNRPREMSNAR